MAFVVCVSSPLLWSNSDHLRFVQTQSNAVLLGLSSIVDFKGSTEVWNTRRNQIAWFILSGHTPNGCILLDPWLMAHSIVLLLCTRANTQCHTPPQLRNESLLISAEHAVCQERMQSRWRPTCKCRPAAVLGCMQPLPLTASVVADAFPQIKSTTTYCDHRLK